MVDGPLIVLSAFLCKSCQPIPDNSRISHLLSDLLAPAYVATRYIGSYGSESRDFSLILQALGVFVWPLGAPHDDFARNVLNDYVHSTMWV